MTASSLSAETDTLTRAIPSFPKTVDPQNSTSSIDHLLQEELFIGLFTMDALGRPEPALVKSWTIKNSLKTYIFHLKQDSKWSDGTPLTAHDFVRTFKRFINPKRSCPYADFFFVIKNA